MSPFAAFGEGIKERFPRTRGDEPSSLRAASAALLFSPHARG